MKSRIAAVVFAATVFWGVAVWAEARYFTAIEFRGLRNLTKAEIIRGVRLAVRGNGVVIDLDSLENSLKKFAIIRGHEVDEKNGRLILTVAERDPRLIIAHRRKDQTIVFEIDERFTAIAFNRIYRPDLPVVHVGAAGMNGADISEETRAFCLILERVKKESPELFREIREIFFDGNRAEVRLEGRRTRFFLSPGVEDFRRLSYFAGYLDRTGRYPDRMTINDDKVLIRKGVNNG